MVCPIGIPALSGKHPGEIAVAVAAQLLMVRGKNPAEHRRTGDHAPVASCTTSTVARRRGPRALRLLPGDSPAASD